VADIFFSYSSQDRERVRRVRDALVDKGFDVFWYQQTPAGIDWDTWIRGELGKAKCAVVCWSAASAASDNVRHEATVAKRQGKLISVFLEPLTELDIPLGLYAQQAANLASWNGDYADDQWRKFRDAVEAKLTPPWVQEKIGQLDAELEGERVRRESAEVHEKAVRAQISKEAKIQAGLEKGT
jgi:TIR domain